jgi:predicted ATPase
VLIEQSHELGEPPEDPLLLFAVLYGLWVANLVAFNGDVMRELAIQFSALAEKQSATAPLMIAHRQMGLSLLHTGEIAEGRAHLEHAIALYDPAEHRDLATRFFGQENGAAIMSWRSIASWLLGYPDAALADAERALLLAREADHLATLVYVINFSIWSYIRCGDYTTAATLADEYDPLQNQLGGSSFWEGWGMMQRGCLLTLTGKAPEAVRTITSGVELMRSTKTTMWMPLFLSYLARANADIGQFDEASTKIREAMTAVETTKERWHEAELNRVAGEIALRAPQPDVAKAEAHFARALEVARQQQAKSWELRAAMSMARLLYAQDERGRARDVLAPVYGWFTQGFDTLDLQQAKLLLDEVGQDQRIDATPSL